MLAVKSDSFRLVATTAYLESGFVLTSVLKINDNNQVKVLARRFGGQQ
jgi:general secretion pathway protein K